MVRSRVDLPEPDGPEDHGDLARLDRQRDALEDFGGAEGLVDVGDLDEAAGGPGRPVAALPADGVSVAVAVLIAVHLR